MITVAVERLDADRLCLRYDYGSGAAVVSETVPAAGLARMLERAETDYYAPLPEDPEETRALLEAYGIQLYAFLDTPRRRLSGYVERTRGTWDVLVLALRTGAGFGHLPWELLHDGEGFLVAAENPVVPVRGVTGSAVERPALSRPLRLAFMACAPTSGGEALDYDAEQATIWEATRRQRIALEVEESGELEQLRHRLLEFGPDDVDVVHLTGHAVHTGRGPVFLTEDAHGRAVRADASDLRDALWRSPALLFLSGCRTAEDPEDGAVASLAESLARSAVPLVLGWGRPVPDTAATDAAAVFYQQLAEGLSPVAALAGTYRRLVRRSLPYWHLLRMFVRGEPPGPLVTPARAPGRDRVVTRSAPRPAAGRVLDPRRFVGRRREIQRALRLLDFRYGREETVGLVVHGFGGVGKTTLAARIRDRLTEGDGDRHCLWLHGYLDESRLTEAILGEHRLAHAFGDVVPGRPLRLRLQSFLDRAPNLLIVLDEFEYNFRPDRLTPDDLRLSGGRPLAAPEAAETLSTLIEAVQGSRREHRIVITSRYLPALERVADLERLELHPLHGPEIERLIDRLQRSAPLPPAVVGWARQLAGQNPRLLEWLFQVARDQLDTGIDEQALRARFRERRGDFLERDVFAPMLLDRIGPEARRLLETAAPYLVPVPVTALARLVGADPGETAERAHRLADLSLLERAEGPDGRTRFRLPLVLGTVFTGTDPAARDGRTGRCARALARELGDFTRVPDPRRVDHGLLREVRRLALEGDRAELAVDATVVLSALEHTWMRFGKSAALCREMLRRVREHRLYYRLAAAESELGHATESDLYFARALEACPADQGAERAAVLAHAALHAAFRAPARCRELSVEAVELARRHGDDRILSFALRTLGRYYAAHGTPGDRAGVAELFVEAMAAAGRVPDDGISTACVRYDRAMAQYLREHDLDTTRTELNAVLAEYQRLDLPMHHSVALRELAGVQLSQTPPDLDGAERLVHEVLRLNQRLGSHRIEAHAEFTLGNIALAREDHPLAEAHYAVARDTAHDIGDQILELNARWSLVRLYGLNGDRERYATGHREVLALAATYELPDHRVELLLDSLERDRGTDGHDRADVLERAQEVASLARETGAEEAEVRAWTVFADEAESSGDPVPALVPALERLLELRRATGGDGALGAALQRLGERLVADERFPEALAPLTEALELAEATADGYARARALGQLGSARRGAGDPGAAVGPLGRGALGWLDLDEPYAAAVVLRDLAGAVRAAGPTAGPDARWCLLAARSLVRTVPSGRTESGILEDLADLLGEPVEQGPSTPWRAAAQRALHRGSPLVVQMSPDMVPHVDPEQGGTALARVERLRAALQAEEGWKLPGVHFQDAADLRPRHFRIMVWGTTVRVTRMTSPFALRDDPVGRMLEELRTQAGAHRAAIEAGEPTPSSPEDGVADLPEEEIRAVLEQAWAGGRGSRGTPGGPEGPGGHAERGPGSPALGAIGSGPPSPAGHVVPGTGGADAEG
ncbi:CHAT domain-containing protein [Streptomyces sp. JNUCC 64]